MSGQTPSGHRIAGSKFVPIFVAAIVVAVFVTILLARRIRPVAEAARLKTFPLTADLNPICQAPGVAPLGLRNSGHCSGNATLLIKAGATGHEVKSIAYAIVGDGTDEPALVGAITPESQATVDLHPLQKGSHVIEFVISDRPADTDELRRAIGDASPRDIPDRLVKVEQYATTHALAGAQINTDRIQFRVEAAAF